MGARNPVCKGVSKKLKGASLRVRMKSVGKVDDRLCMRILLPSLIADGQQTSNPSAERLKSKAAAGKVAVGVECDLDDGRVQRSKE
jgi:hypothetical protein